MIYTFLCDEDINAAIKSDSLTQIVGNDTTLIPKAIKRAVKYMSDFIAARYKVADIFPNILQWDATKDYLVSVEQTLTYTDVLGNDATETFTPLYYRDASGIIKNVVYYNGKFYVALADNANIQPGSDEDIWEETDPRDANIVGMCTDVALYFLNIKVQPQKIPQHRIDNFNLAKEWLGMVKDADITPDLPKEIDIQKDNDTPSWGSGPTTGKYY